MDDLFAHKPANVLPGFRLMLCYMLGYLQKYDWWICRMRPLGHPILRCLSTGTSCRKHSVKRHPEKKLSLGRPAPSHLYWSWTSSCWQTQRRAGRGVPEQSEGGTEFGQAQEGVRRLTWGFLSLPLWNSKWKLRKPRWAGRGFAQGDKCPLSPRRVPVCSNPTQDTEVVVWVPCSYSR